MPFRSPKMYTFIFGFHRFVWWPKCTPASSRSLIAIPGKVPLSLAFAELEPLARSSESVLLALLDARVRRQETILLQLLPQLRVELHERPRDAEPHRASLSVDAAAVDGCQDVELVARLRQEQRPPHLRTQRIGREVFIELPMVDGNGSLAGAKEDASGRCLATASGVVFDACQAM